MGILSSTASITRYKVHGRVQKPIIDTIAAGLQKQAISEIDNDAAEKSVGWTSFQTPYTPDFTGSSFVFGSYFVFSLRIDKKSISAKTLKKHYTIQERKRLTETERAYLTGNEKKMLKENVLHALSLKMPATPHVYDVVWDYENGKLWYFSNLKAANEDLEVLFSRSFRISLIRMFPYTAADGTANLSDSEKDLLSKLTPTNFTG